MSAPALTHRQLREIAEAATAERVRRHEQVEDQAATVTELSRQLRNAEAVLAELSSDLDDAAQIEHHAHQAVTDLEIADHEAYLARSEAWGGGQHPATWPGYIDRR